MKTKEEMRYEEILKFVENYVEEHQIRKVSTFAIQIGITTRTLAVFASDVEKYLNEKKFGGKIKAFSNAARVEERDSGYVKAFEAAGKAFLKFEANQKETVPVAPVAPVVPSVAQAVVTQGTHSSKVPSKKMKQEGAVAWPTERQMRYQQKPSSEPLVKYDFYRSLEGKKGWNVATSPDPETYIKIAPEEKMSPAEIAVRNKLAEKYPQAFTASGNYPHEDKRGDVVIRDLISRNSNSECGITGAEARYLQRLFNKQTEEKAALFNPAVVIKAASVGVKQHY